MDLGDKTSGYCQLDKDGLVIQEGSVATTKKGMLQVFGAMKRCRIAIEVGTHSPRLSRLLGRSGMR
jgi:transposase